MSRHSNFPTLYEDCRTVNISNLKKWGYLKADQLKNGSIFWTSNGQRTSTIGITVNMFAASPYIELDYKCNGNLINYSLQIVSVPSNIGRGNLLYFRCPATGKRCRKLYLIDGRFLHRKAFTGCFYEKQTYSKRNRGLFRSFETLTETDKAYDTIYRKHFKKYYAGKPTKRYYKAMQKITSISLKDALEIEESIYRK